MKNLYKKYLSLRFNKVNLRVKFIYNQFAIDQKDKMETSVKEKGLIKEAQDKAQKTIQTYIKSIDVKDEYKINISVTE